MQQPNQSRDRVQTAIKRRRALLPYLVLVLGLLFTSVVAYYFSRLAETQDRGRFLTFVQEVDDRLRGRVQTSIALLRAGTALFAASDEVTLTEFDRFVGQIELNRNYPGIQGIGFSRRFLSSEKSALVAEMQKMVDPAFGVWPDYERSEYHSIVFLNPHDEKNKLAVGFDMFTESGRRAAMEQARDTGEPTASARVVLVQDSKSGVRPAGFLIYAPVYRNGAPINTIQERRQALVGFVYSPFRVDDFVAPITGEHKPVLRLEVYDSTKLTPESLLYSSEGANSNPNPHFFATTTQNVGGREWTLRYETKPSFEFSSRRTLLPYIVAAGVCLSVLLFGLTRSEVRAREMAELAAANMRDSEAKIRQTLADRALAEEALRESEERYRELVENANDIVFVMDEHGQLTATNKAAEAITGFSTDELLQMNLTDILSKDSLSSAERIIKPGGVNTERANFEVDLISKSGNSVTLEVSSKPIFKGGARAGVQGIARDISTRRRAEEALRQADQRALAEYERLLARISSLAQALGTSRDLTTIFQALRAFTEVSVPCNGLFVSLYDPVENVRTACYCWGDGVEIDISQLPPMPVTTVGPNSRAVRTGQVVITEDYMEAMRGHQVVMVETDKRLHPQTSMIVPMAVMGRIVGTIEVQSYQPRCYRQEHEAAMRMAANLTAVAIENVGLLKRESNAREAAEQSNRLKDEFLATVSHELRTPLTAILGWSRLLEADSLDSDISKQAIETIWRNAKSQAQIIDDILDTSRIITGNLYLDLHPVELNPIVMAAINVVRPTADARGVSIEVNFDQTPAVVSGDANRLQQVVWNLLSNAVKFSDRGGRVMLGLTRTDDGRVEFIVSDTGRGIRNDFLPYVFDRFRQADSSTTRQHGGLGLGLAIARHLVEIHGGTIRAESAGPGEGATFTIQLPLIEPSRINVPRETDEPEDSIASRAMLSGVQVLVVDDDEDTLELMSTALSSRQASVTAVSSAGDALQAFKVSRPDVVITDIAMPETDGYCLIAQLRALEGNGEATPAIAITAYAKEEDRIRALSSGFQLYLAKPIEITDLVSAVARAARRESEV